MTESVKRTRQNRGLYDRYNVKERERKREKGED